MSEPKQIPFMVAWEKKTKLGDTFLSCKYGDRSIVAFKKRSKINERQPDWEFFDAKPYQKAPPVQSVPEDNGPQDWPVS